MKKLDGKQLKELERLKDWSLTMLHFMGIKTPSGALNNVDKFIEVVTQTYEKEDLRGMNHLFKMLLPGQRVLAKSKSQN